jgi:hypothetical protein
MTLSLQAASAFVADYRNPYQRDDWLVSYQQDLLAPFGVPFDEKFLKQGANIGFQELSERALDGLGERPKPDLVIVAHGLPDHYPFRSIGGHVDKLVGGGSENFAISDQGLRAPFTALRVGAAYARSGRCRLLALVVVEQSTFGHDEPLARDGKLADSAAVLLFGQGPGTWEIAAGDPAEGERVLVVAGPWTDPARFAGTPVHRVAPGSYCTSVWLDLARHHEEWARDHDAIVLCDTDPRTGRSHAALLRRTNREGT